jgi:heptosyltransferase-1
MARILFVKTSSLGDVVHNCPAVSDAARRFPEAAIDWAVEEAFADVVRLHPAVARVIPVAIRRWRAALARPATWSELAAFRRLLRAERYDCVIDTQGLVKSALIARLARGRRHGFDAASAREPVAARLYDQVHAVAPALHAVERNRRLAAAALGYAVDGACDYGLAAPGDAPLAPPGPYAMLLTMTSRADKLWPDGHWRALGRSLAAQGVLSVLPWGSAEERDRCEAIAAAIPGAIVPARMELGALARVIARARCAVGVDTGLAHLAAALGVPALGIYCGSDPALTGLCAGPGARSIGGPGAAPGPDEAIAALEALL